MNYAQRWQLAVALKQPYPIITETGALGLIAERLARDIAIVAVGGAVGFLVGGGKGAAIGAGVTAAGIVALIVAGGFLV